MLSNLYFCRLNVLATYTLSQWHEYLYTVQNCLTDEQVKHPFEKKATSFFKRKLFLLTSIQNNC